MQWQTLQQLEQQLQSANAETRRQAAEQLGKFKDVRAVEPLVMAFTQDRQDLQVLYAVVMALVDIGDARAVPALAETLQHHQDDIARTLAAEALGRIGDPQAVEPLVRALQEDRGTGGVRAAAAGALGEIGGAQAVEALIGHLQSDKFEVLCSVAEALGKIGDPRAVEPLVSVLREAEDVLQSSAAEALGKIGDPRAVEPLVSTLREATSSAQQTAATALAIVGEIGTAESLLEALHHWQVYEVARRVPTIPPGGISDGEDDVERVLTIPPGGIGNNGEDDLTRSAAWILPFEEIGGVQAVLPLVWALNHVENVVRSAAGALGKLGDARAVDVLIGALARNEKSEALRGAVAEALGRIGDARAVALVGALQEDAELRHTGFLGHGPVVALVGALEKNAEQEALRGVTVAEALGRIGDPRAVEPLMSALQDKDGRVRQAAAEALTTLGWLLREDTSPPPQARGFA